MQAPGSAAAELKRGMPATLSADAVIYLLKDPRTGELKLPIRFVVAAGKSTDAGLQANDTQSIMAKPASERESSRPRQVERKEASNSEHTEASPLDVCADNDEGQSPSWHVRRDGKFAPYDKLVVQQIESAWSAGKRCVAVGPSCAARTASRMVVRRPRLVLLFTDQECRSRGIHAAHIASLV